MEPSNGQTTIIEEQPLPATQPKGRKARSYKSELEQLQAKYQRLKIACWTLAAGLLLAITFILK